MNEANTSRNSLEQLQEAAEFIQTKSMLKPKTAIVLGSGLSAFADQLNNATTVSYTNIPHFPTSSIAGHRGELILGTLNKVPLLVMSGRVHGYEGYTPQEVVFPIRVIARLGIETLLITNAAGACNPDFKVGQMMLITDQINFTGSNPLVGPNLQDLGPRFPDMSQAFHPNLQGLIQNAAKQSGIKLQSGTYIGVQGPSYETPAEIRMFHRLGADAVGMSTVYEVIAANHAGLKVAGLSVITNMGSGLGHAKLDHVDVKAQGDAIKDQIIELLQRAIGSVHHAE